MSDKGGTADKPLTEEQKVVFDQVEQFISDPHPAKQWFSFHSLAGCGKTFLLCALARKHHCVLAAYTGKAASVITRKSGILASTIHSALYNYIGLDEETDQPRFMDKIEAGEWHGKLMLVDEDSMLDEWIAEDILKTGCKLVTSGDPGQLPPVRGKQFFRDGDAELKTIHRQAWDSPIIRQAYNVRYNGVYENDGPDFQVCRNIRGEDVLEADIILCWRNATRISLNRMVRSWKGLGGVAKAGEPVMCLKNDHKAGILNGAIYTLLEDHVGTTGRITIENERGEVRYLKSAWIEDIEPRYPSEAHNPFAFAYCATVHKSQGSEWDKVVLVDEYNQQNDRNRWAYTGISRAAKSIIVKQEI